MNDAIRAAQQLLTPATQRLPATFGYPKGGIAGRVAMGLALLVAGCALLLQSGLAWLAGGILLGLVGGFAAVSNLYALLDSDRRKIVLDETAVEIRYGFSRRRYPFVEYSDYRIARLGLRRFLTALPISIDRSLDGRDERVRVTIHDRPAFLTPMPVLGRGAPATLLEWQTTLNELRRAAIADAGLSVQREAAKQEADAEEARRAATWRTREQAGARPSRLSRRAYVRARLAVTLVFLALLLAPAGFVALVQRRMIAICGAAGGSGCLGIDPSLQQIVMIGAPLLALIVFVIGHACLAIRRAHDLDEDLSFWSAAVGSFGRYGPLQRRLSGEEGSDGTNRFGPNPLR